MTSPTVLPHDRGGRVTSQPAQQKSPAAGSQRSREPVPLRVLVSLDPEHPEPRPRQRATQRARRLQFKRRQGGDASLGMVRRGRARPLEQGARRPLPDGAPQRSRRPQPSWMTSSPSSPSPSPPGRPASSGRFLRRSPRSRAASVEPAAQSDTVPGVPRTHQFQPSAPSRSTSAACAAAAGPRKVLSRGHFAGNLSRRRTRTGTPSLRVTEPIWPVKASAARGAEEGCRDISRHRRSAPWPGRSMSYAQTCSDDIGPKPAHRAKSLSADERT
jgi:hypothetical protein